MSTLDTQMAGRRVAAGDADRRKKLLLVGMLVLLAVLLAIQLPKLLNSSDSPSSTAATSSGSPSSTVAPSVTTPATSTAAVTGGQPVASVPASTPAERASAIREMMPRDPFVPVTRESAPASSSSSSSSSSPASASAPSASTRTHPTSDSPPLTVLPAGSAPTNPAAGEAGPVTPAAPTAAMIWTNGKRQVVGRMQTFDVGDATFKLVAVNDGAIRLQAAAGSFTGGKRTLTIRKGRSLILENKATGVRYTLRFAGGTTESATAPADAMAPTMPATSATPFEFPSGAESASNGR